MAEPKKYLSPAWMRSAGEVLNNALGVMDANPIGGDRSIAVPAAPPTKTEPVPRNSRLDPKLEALIGEAVERAVEAALAKRGEK